MGDVQILNLDREADRRREAFWRQHGYEEIERAVRIWASFQPALQRRANQPSLSDAWALWRMGMGSKCEHCGKVVSKSNFLVHTAHCERERRFAPKSGQVFLPKTPYPVMVGHIL